jgi:phosphoglycerate kinase
VINKARTVIWNGPLGYFEDPRYAKATHALVRILAHARAKAYVGGGETVKAVLTAGAEKKIHFVSTGGGAMLSFLQGKPCPALRALIKK